MDQIRIAGIDWGGFQRPLLTPPWQSPCRKVSLYERATAVANHTLLRPRQVIATAVCTGCGACARRCPTGAIQAAGSAYEIDRGRCADCGCCVKVCDVDAVHLKFVGLSRALRFLIDRQRLDPKPSNPLDPAPEVTPR